MSNETKLMEIIAEILEVDIGELTFNTELNEDLWDSLAVVTFISEVDSNFEKIISPAEVSAAKTVADLLSLVK
ncbi:hypothetical protein CF168_13985 [Shewanella bicestrii]|uniref:Carrier domain-containing protein n=1 Tax=Shewanella bicestrii TaxID=2018305 RepID=A0A220UNS6_9GAMM|nr:acyl carrier protein [Shewanella bicestrii]ASK69874.1 hypothetical protein CF168_13985 [Shewanella bicestrii]